MFGVNEFLGSGRKLIKFLKLLFDLQIQQLGHRHLVFFSLVLGTLRENIGAGVFRPGSFRRRFSVLEEITNGECSK